MQGLSLLSSTALQQAEHSGNQLPHLPRLHWVQRRRLRAGQKLPQLLGATPSRGESLSGKRCLPHPRPSLLRRVSFQRQLRGSQPGSRCLRQESRLSCPGPPENSSLALRSRSGGRFLLSKVPSKSEECVGLRAVP